MKPRWRQAVRRLRGCHPSWGARKLRVRLRQLHPRVRLPAVRTLARWLDRWGLVKARRRRQRRGPVLSPTVRRVARQANEVWTMDFKGRFAVGDGSRAEPLTVRDLKSRFILDVRLLARNTYAAVRRALVRVFGRYGLPRFIRVDNGPPFGGGGPRGLSRLAVWWRRLGIGLEYGRPAHPEDNAAHEQMHGVYQAEVAAYPAANRLALQRRSDRWRAYYNHRRPHEALGLRPPAALYRPSSRRLPKKLRAWKYPTAWIKRPINLQGRVYWQGKLRFIGEAFGGEVLGFRLQTTGIWEVFMGPDLLGELHQKNHSLSLRPARVF